AEYTLSDPAPNQPPADRWPRPSWAAFVERPRASKNSVYIKPDEMSMAAGSEADLPLRSGCCDSIGPAFPSRHFAGLLRLRHRFQLWCSVVCSVFLDFGTVVMNVIGFDRSWDGCNC